jgi:hypothetical protein
MSRLRLSLDELREMVERESGGTLTVGDKEYSRGRVKIIDKSHRVPREKYITRKELLEALGTKEKHPNARLLNRLLALLRFFGS